MRDERQTGVVVPRLVSFNDHRSTRTRVAVYNRVAESKKTAVSVNVGALTYYRAGGDNDAGRDTEGAIKR